jgi:hypothetical protein
MLSSWRWLSARTPILTAKSTLVKGQNKIQYKTPSLSHVNAVIYLSCVSSLLQTSFTLLWPRKHFLKLCDTGEWTKARMVFRISNVVQRCVRCIYTFYKYFCICDFCFPFRWFALCFTGWIFCLTSSDCFWDYVSLHLLLLLLCAYHRESARLASVCSTCSSS